MIMVQKQKRSISRKYDEKQQQDRQLIRVTNKITIHTIISKTGVVPIFAKNSKLVGIMPIFVIGSDPNPITNGLH
jgi:hypothetical protein